MYMFFGLMIFLTSLILADEIVSPIYSVDSFGISVSGEDLVDYYGANSFDAIPKTIELSPFVESPIYSVSSGGGGGGGGGLESTPTTEEGTKCRTDVDCLTNEICLSNVCYKRFIADLVNVSTNTLSGRFFNFSYELQAASYIEGTVINEFWIESLQGKKVATGKAILFLSKGQYVIKETQIYIPEYLETGEYYLYSESYYEGELINSTDRELVLIYGKEPEKTTNLIQWIVFGSIFVGVIVIGIILNKKRFSFWKYITSINISRGIYRFSEKIVRFFGGKKK